MALRRQNLSPTANLLRNSRLFALPTPLPRPNVAEPYGSGAQNTSKTATLPYPTHQAITTTRSSLARGDWGLKRPIPSRSRIVQTSNPVLRIKQLDTIEHITDYDSAADHVRTREKWEELGIPILKGTSHTFQTDLTSLKPRTAFDERGDITAYESVEFLDEAGMYLEALKENAKKNAGKKQSFTPFSPPQPTAAQRNGQRWKHEGPWLPGMSADEFTTYITTELLKRRAEFNKYLVEYVKNEIYTQRQVSARQADILPLDAAEAEDLQAKQAKEWSQISKADIKAGVNTLRRKTAVDPLNSNLVQKLIIPFLRLPPLKLKSTSFAALEVENKVDTKRFSDETTPLSTHPSAGLGYLRTTAFLSNHPILGPQALPTPVQARVIQPLTTSTTKESHARLGVAGFVTNDEHRNATVFSTGKRKDVETIDIETPGGMKLYVQPQYAGVTNDGRIHIKVKRGVGSDVLVAKGELDDRPPVREHVEADPLRNLISGGSGVKELDEQSSQAKDFREVMGRMTQQYQQKAQPGQNGGHVFHRRTMQGFQGSPVNPSTE